MVLPLGLGLGACSATPITIPLGADSGVWMADAGFTDTATSRDGIHFPDSGTVPGGDAGMSDALGGLDAGNTDALTDGDMGDGMHQDDASHGEGGLGDGGLGDGGLGDGGLGDSSHGEGGHGHGDGGHADDDAQPDLGDDFPDGGAGTP